MINDSGHRTNFSTGAVRDIGLGKGRMDLLPWHGIIEVSKHCEEGALKYGEHNVDKGIPEWSLISSAARHLGEYIAGMTNEDHLRAAAWNILWALDQRTTHPELMTLHDWRSEASPAKAFEHDGCVGCAYSCITEFDHPCVMCKGDGSDRERRAPNPERLLYTIRRG